jgi:asparagine synthase (glutamine-hydrolysing)
MCGISGFLGGGGFQATAEDRAILLSMNNRLVHRGPDDSGIFFDPDSKIGMGHRRLSILDVSPLGHQPMNSVGGRYTMVFNGEIYNHLELREQLQAANSNHAWRGRSDTETLLACFETWGVKRTIELTLGMFAIAVWDRMSKVLTIVRDRLGEKPLYYGWHGSGSRRVFLFGSELKAMKAHPSFSPEIDRGAICSFLRHSSIPAPHSIYRGTFKLNPGCLLTVSTHSPEPQIETYWSLSQAVNAGIQNPFDGSAEAAVDQLEVLLRDAVGRQMQSDVPLGAFLSGGIDSSLIVAMMQSQSSRPVKTFTIGFDQADYNEAVDAKAVAKHLRTDHTEMYMTSEQAIDVIARLPKIYCEPFADSSQIPTFLVSQLAKKSVTVSLSGDGGDELFAGYNRYVMTHVQWNRLALIPRQIRALLAKIIVSISPSSWNKLGQFISNHRAIGDKLHKAAGVLDSRSADELYHRLISHQNRPEEWVLDAKEPVSKLVEYSKDFQSLSMVERMMAMDAVSYLPDDLLVKVDRAAMAVSLESRIPFLDHRIVEFAWTLPINIKIRSGKTKWPLRQLLYRHVPQQLIERPKMGFGIPLDTWLRGPLRDWTETLLAEDRLKNEGYLNPTPIRKKWMEHLSGGRNWSYELWDVLMFQAWLENQSDD